VYPTTGINFVIAGTMRAADYIITDVLFVNTTSMVKNKLDHVTKGLISVSFLRFTKESHLHTFAISLVDEPFD
jgi:hypothetical protein